MKSSNPNITLYAERCPLYVGNLRKNSYEFISFFCKTNPIFAHFGLKTLVSLKNKPNSNPIKANFGPISRVAKPNKPNFFRRLKMNAFAWITCAIGRSFTMILIMLLAEFTTPKGVNFIFLLSQNAPNMHYIARTRILNNF